MEESCCGQCCCCRRRSQTASDFAMTTTTKQMDSEIRHHHDHHRRRFNSPKGSHWWRTGRKMLSSGGLCNTLLLVILVASGTVVSATELTYSIPEEGQPELFVGDVFQDVDFYTRYEGDSAVLGQLRFQFLRGEHPSFSIDNRTGVIRTSRRIDREAVCANEQDCEIRLDVAVQPSQYFEIIRVAVQITDVNDNSPTFSEQRVTHHLLESVLPGTNVLLFTAEDLDSPDLSIQRFELLPASNSKFRVVSASQPDGSKEVRLKLQEPLDRESEQEYNLRIVAYDGGTPMNTGSVDIQILVQDFNDNQPTFTQPQYDVSVPENLEVPQRILQVEATDPDSGTNGEIVYGFSASTVKNHGDRFDIDEDTGEIFLMQPVDYESVQIYHLSVTATDKGPGAMASEAVVVVTVTDVNDHPPEIFISVLSLDGTATVPEDAPVGQFVSHISVMDEDSGRNAEVICSVSSAEFSLEYLYDTEYQIVSTQIFDREVRDEYAVLLSCNDNGDHQLTSQRTIQVSVSDINDQAPVFEQSTYDAEILENSFMGAVATTVRARDADIGTNAEIEYRLERDVRELFMVEPETGEVKARVSLDREQLDHFSFKVYAVDKGIPAMTATASVFVRVLDVNDEIPEFSQPSYSFGVFENEVIGTDVGALTAEDRDGFPFNQFNYTFRTPTDRFAIDRRTGRITTTRRLDREEQAVYHLVAVAMESGKSPSSTVSLSIFVADVNDNPPVFTSPAEHTIQLSKDVPLGYIAKKLTASDLDIGNNAKITYAIVGGNNDDIFDIDAARGTIIIIKDLKTYEDAIFFLNVSATDNGIPSMTTYATLAIHVNGTLPLTPPSGETSSTRLGGNNLIIVIVLVAISSVITIILVMAIICIKRQDRRRQQSNGKYNCRMEALKFLTISKRKKLVGGSSTSGSSTGSSEGSDLAKNKKEVSFSVDVVEETGANNKSRGSWPSAIDNTVLQNPRACSSLLNNLNSPPLVVGNGTGHYDHHSNQTGGQAYPGNGHMQNLGNTHREMEIAQLLELLKRDGDAGSVASGDGSNTDSGRGASEEGDNTLVTGHRGGGGGDNTLVTGHRGGGDNTLVTGHRGGGGAGGDVHNGYLTHLPPVPEDSYSSNQVVPSCCDSSLSFLSHHNTTTGSYLPPEHIRAASRNSNNAQRPPVLRTFQNSTVSSTGLAAADKSASPVLNMSAVTDEFYQTSPKKLKSILKQPNVSYDLHNQTPLDQLGMTNYLRTRVAARQPQHSDGDLSDIEESEMTEDNIGYSCVDVSDILNSKAQQSTTVATDDDDDVTTTSGSYMVDPKELCDEIDELFFKNMA